MSSKEFWSTSLREWIIIVRQYNASNSPDEGMTLERFEELEKEYG